MIDVVVAQSRSITSNELSSAFLAGKFLFEDVWLVVFVLLGVNLDGSLVIKFSDLSLGAVVVDHKV